jgi:hypothetical protein
MKGDFSRLLFAPRKHYSSVRLQQGRVTLDRDWNEQASIREQHERTVFEELVGACGSPSAGGFALIREGTTLHVTAGRSYVGGFCCELEHDVPLDQLLARAITPSRGRTDLVYLDVWERHMTAIDDPGLLEVALNGADTTTRLRVAWKLAVREDVGTVSISETAALLPRGPDGIMYARAPNGYSGPDNQLYRVEIHAGGDADTATFKWSRNNGSTVFAIEQFIAPTSVSVVVRPGAQRSLAVDDWVEVSGDESESADVGGTLARVTELGGDTTVVLDRAVSQHSGEGHPRLRPWDQRSGPALPLATEWTELEAGIEVRFSDGEYRSGDYWTIPARPAIDSIEWPGDRGPDGIEHRYAPVALVTWNQTSHRWDAQIDDCRRVFTPLTDVHAELAQLRQEVAELRKHRAET